MPSYGFLSLAALVAVAQAITVTSPSKDTLWNSAESNTISWTSVSTDPTTMDIYLVHQASQPQISDLLFSNVDISKGSVSVSGLQLPTGDAYQINFVKPETTAQIYAQSEQFNVTGTASSATSTLAGYTGTAVTLLTTSTGTATTSTGTITSSRASSATGASAASGTRSSSSSATSASATGNSAAVVTGSVQLAAMVLGAVAMFA